MEEGEIKFVQANDVIMKLVIPFFVVLGTIMNIVFMIVSLKKFNMSSSMMLIFSLNILDTVGLYTEPFWLLVQHWFNNGATQSMLACQIVLYMFNFVVTCTGWITVYICFEQASKLCFHANGLITHKRGIILLIMTILISCGSNLYFFLSEEHYVPEVSMSSMTCSIQPQQAQDIYEQNTNMEAVRYRFNWKWLNKLMFCFFPVTFTLACLIAIWQGMKTTVQNETSVTQTIRRTMSVREREQVKFACASGIMLILSIVPLTFFKTQIADMKVAETQLICSILSFLIYINFSMKLLYFCALSPYFRMNVFNIFKTGVIARQIRKLSTFQDHRAMELLSLKRNRDVNIHFEEACSDTESYMSSSPAGRSETVAFNFTDTFERVETPKQLETSKYVGSLEDEAKKQESEELLENAECNVENSETLENVELSGNMETFETKVMLETEETSKCDDSDC